MVQTPSDPSSSSSRHSKSKWRKTRKRVNPSSISKQLDISFDNPPSSTLKPQSSSSKPNQSSAKPVSPRVKNNQKKTNQVWIRKDPIKSASNPTSESSKPSPFSPELPQTLSSSTQFEASSSVTFHDQSKRNNSYDKESSYERSIDPPASPSASEGSLLGSSPPSPKLRPILYPIKRSATWKTKGQQNKATYSLSEENSLPIYKIPKQIRMLIKKNIVPQVLNEPLSPSSYTDYFATLLYAEELYLQKWSKFRMVDVEVELHDARIHRWYKKKMKSDKVFVVFEIDSIKERRPFLLSRDIVYARPSGTVIHPFEGIVCHVALSTHVLVDFEDDFHFQHRPSRRYDINFSFNRICFRRAHQAIRATSNPSFPNSSLLFPDILHKHSLPCSPSDALDEILGLEIESSPPPYVVEGQLCVSWSKSKQKKLSKTGELVREAVRQIYQSSPQHQILICSPLNATCDELMISLQKVIPEFDMFRANAAFREIDVVPTDILPSCPYDGECFTCPSFEQLKEFRVIFSTLVSCFRLHKEGLAAGHFSHIFIVDASAGTEPETMIPLANFAHENTAVVITGSPTNTPSLVRSDMARNKGLKTSYFERLRIRNTNQAFSD